MEQQFSHITINGKPLCQCEGHTMGLMNELRIVCEHGSTLEASKAAVKIFRRDPERFKGSDVLQVVLGECPAFEGVQS